MATHVHHHDAPVHEHFDSSTGPVRDEGASSMLIVLLVVLLVLGLFFALARGGAFDWAGMNGAAPATQRYDVNVDADLPDVNVPAVNIDNDQAAPNPAD